MNSGLVFMVVLKIQLKAPSIYLGLFRKPDMRQVRKDGGCTLQFCPQLQR